MKAMTLIAATAVLTAGAAFAATGGHGASHKGSTKAPTRTVKLDASEYAFNAITLSFKAGETVKFVLTNKGKLKHSLTIGTAQEQKTHQDEMAEMAGMNHDETEHAMPGNSIHVAPGETRELVWTFSKPGQLLFACSYPGHADLGMQGAITVQ